MNPGRPTADEHAPYFSLYIDRVPEGEITGLLRAQHDEMVALLRPLSREQLLFRPTPPDWNILEVLGHITDGEQLFAARALRIARGDITPLPGFEQDDYVAAANFSSRTLDEMLTVYSTMRHASIALFASFDQVAWQRRGTVSGKPCSARAWAYIAAGHELHHLADFRARYQVG